MKIFAYALRPYDELGYLEALSHELGFEFAWTADYPTLDNVGLAAGAVLCFVLARRGVNADPFRTPEGRVRPREADD